MTAKVHYADLWGVRETYAEDEQGERVLTGGKFLYLGAGTTATGHRAPRKALFLAFD